ncbi:MAG: 5'-methylthioadenosine/S-adenosylhomocysteine nucleosidase, partial [Pseudomonadota bacterium]
GDSFIGREDQAELVRRNFPTMKAVEMEAASIAQVCFMMSTPSVVIRSLSDIAGKESPITFEQYLKVAAKNSANLVMHLIKSIQS